MPTSFEKIHADQIQGVLTTVDRLIIHGHLRSFWKRSAFTELLNREGLRFRDFGRYVCQASEKVRLHASAIARRTGRPFIYQDRVVRGKDDLARAIARRDGISEGLICVFSTLELATCFALVKGAIVPRQRKCLHIYFYLIDRELGFMHVRIQTWFPFKIQIYLNGREWLARQLDKRGIGYVRYENTFVRIDDLEVAEELCRSFGRRRWHRILDVFARRANPLLPLIRRLGFGDYYWSIDDCEVATDIMWKSRRGLLGILDDLLDYAIRAFSADDVVRFLGSKILPSKAELDSQLKMLLARGDVAAARRRPEGRRIKHRLRRNWIKMYDKWSVLRVETVINNPHAFRVLRFEEDASGKKRGRWMRMGNGIQNLWRYLEVGEAANRRYLEALAVVRPTRQAIAELDELCRGKVRQGRRCSRLNPVGASECELFRSVLAGEHVISGFRNRDLRLRLYPDPVGSAEEAKRSCARVSRLIAKLRGHGLVAKVKGGRLYRVTLRGQRVMGAALRFRHKDFTEALAA